MVTYLEQFMAEGFVSIFGSTEMSVLVLIGLFVAIMLMSRSGMDYKIAILGGILILAGALMGWLLILVGLALAIIMALALMKFMNR